MEQSNSKLKDLNFNLRRYIFNFLPYSDLINVYYSNKGLLMHAYDLVSFKQILDAYLFMHNIIMMNFRECCEEGDKWGRRGLLKIEYINNFEGVDIICFLLKRFPLFSKEIIVQALITFFTVFREKYKNNLILLNTECIEAHNHHFYKIYSKVLPNLNKDDFVYDICNLDELNEILSHVKYIQEYSTDLLKNPNCDNFKFKNFEYLEEIAKFPNSIENLAFYYYYEHTQLLEEFLKDHQSTIKTIRDSKYESIRLYNNEYFETPNHIRRRREYSMDKKEFIQNLSLFSNLKVLSLPNNMLWDKFINKVKFPEKLKRIYFNGDNGILRKKEPFPNLKEIGEITLDSKENKAEFFKFISVNNNITKITNLTFDSTICSFKDLIKKLSILNLKVLSLTIKETNSLDENKLEVAFDLIKNSFKDLKEFKLKFYNEEFSNKFIIDSVIDIQENIEFPFNLIVHLLKNNTKLPFYHIYIMNLMNLNEFLNYLEINKEFQILKKIKGLKYEEIQNEKKSKSFKINYPLKLNYLFLPNYKYLNKFKSIETLRLVLDSIPTKEIIKKIDTKKLLSLSIYCKYDYQKTELIDFMNYFVDNYKKEFNKVVHFKIDDTYNFNYEEWKKENCFKKLKKIFSIQDNNNCYKIKLN